MKFIIFDLDDTLLCGDCEAGWINFLVIKGLLDGDEHSSKLNQFDIDYRKGILNFDECSSPSSNPLITRKFIHPASQSPHNKVSSKSKIINFIFQSTKVQIFNLSLYQSRYVPSTKENSSLLAKENKCVNVFGYSSLKLLATKSKPLSFKTPS